jgi:hypothetical protein
VFLEPAARAGQRPTRPQPGHEVGNLGEVPDDFVSRPLVVRARIGRVPVLERHEVLVVLSHAPGDLDRSVRPLLGRSGDDLGTVQLEEPHPLLAGVLGDHHSEPVALPGRDHPQSDARIAGGWLQDDGAPRQAAFPLCLLHHGQGDSILQRAGRVLPLQLGPHPDWPGLG